MSLNGISAQEAAIIKYMIPISLHCHRRHINDWPNQPRVNRPFQDSRYDAQLRRVGMASLPRGLQLRIVAISDTHELHREVDIPPADILIHAGDWTHFSRSLPAIADFDAWLAELPIRLVSIASPGNHEFYLESDPSRRDLTPHATVLIGEGITVEGLNIWASPVTPLYGGSFGLSKPADRTKYYEQIPTDTHILITHGPPYGILDGEPGSPDHHGDPELLQAVLRIKPRLHIFGHVHSGYGVYVTEDTTFVNVALLGRDGGIENMPFVFDLNGVAP